MSSINLTRPTKDVLEDVTQILGLWGMRTVCIPETKSFREELPRNLVRASFQNDLVGISVGYAEDGWLLLLLAPTTREDMAPYVKRIQNDGVNYLSELFADDFGSPEFGPFGKGEVVVMAFGSVLSSTRRLVMPAIARALPYRTFP